MVTRDRNQEEAQAGIRNGHASDHVQGTEHEDSAGTTPGSTYVLPADLQRSSDEALRKFERQYRTLADQ